MNTRLADACQADVRSSDPSGDFGEHSRDALTSLRLPPLEFGSQCVVTLVDERADRLRVQDREDELHLLPAQGLDLGNGARHARLGDIRLTYSTEALSQKGLDGLDPSSVIRNRDLLAEALPALRACAGRPGLPRCACRCLEEDATDRLDFLCGSEGERWPDR